MAKYVPSPRDWVREQVELYENSGGTEGTTLRDTGLPVIIVTHIGNKTGAIRKTPLMRVKDGNSYVLVGSQGGAPTDPVWVHNLRVNPVKSVMRPSCDQCGCARSRPSMNGLGSGSLPLRRTRLTRNTKSAPPGGFRFLLQSSLSAPKAISGAIPRMRATSRSNRRAARQSTSSCSNFQKPM
jgi:hypothetical protein